MVKGNVEGNTVLADGVILICVEWNSGVYRDFTVSVPRHYGEFTHHDTPLDTAPVAKAGFSLFKNLVKQFSRVGARLKV